MSQDDANAQISTYEKLWKDKADAEDKLAQAKQQGLIGPKLKVLEAQLAQAKAAYDKFIAFEPEPAPEEEPEEVELLPQTPSTSAETPDETTSSDTQPTPAQIKVEPKPLGDDPWKGLYTGDQTDPYKGLYAEDQNVSLEEHDGKDQEA